MSYTQRWTEVNCPLATMAPTVALGAVGEHNSGYVLARDYHRLLILVMAGETVNGTIDIDIEEAQDAAGTGAQAFDGGNKDPDQLTAADEGGIVAIEIQGEEFEPGYDYINVEVTVGVAQYTYAIYVLGIVPRYASVPVTTWTQIVD